MNNTLHIDCKILLSGIFHSVFISHFSIWYREFLFSYKY